MLPKYRILIKTGIPSSTKPQLYSFYSKLGNTIFEVESKEEVELEINLLLESMIYTNLLVVDTSAFTVKAEIE